ncbi:MAG: hypothetical protein P1P64_03520 [Treponemataceae bacterium]
MSLRRKLDELLGKVIVPPHKNADDPLTNEDWNSVASSIENLKEAVEAIRDMPACTIAPGKLYIRFPGQPEPYGALGKYPWTSKGDWTMLDEKWAGAFLRMSGGNASKFRRENEYVKYDAKTKGSGGGQEDALQNHTHAYLDQVPTGVNRQIAKRGSYGNNTERKSTENSNGRTDIETRPKNITVEMYIYKMYD